MLATITYTIVCFVIAAVLASAYLMTRSVKSRDEIKSWRIFIFCYLFTLAAPYGYIEVLTRNYGRPMERAIQRGYLEANLNGPIKYYKIMSMSDDRAKALVVGTDAADWGGVEHPVVSVTLSKRGQNWKAESFKVLTSGRLNQDNMVLPPFW